MDNIVRDAGIIAVLLERRDRRRLTKLLTLIKKLENGTSPTDFELSYLQVAVDDTRQVIPLIDRYPDYQVLWAQLMVLYNDISGLALQLEKTTSE